MRNIPFLNYKCVIVLQLIIAFSIGTICKAEDSISDYLSGKWYLDTEAYVLDLTNGQSHKDGFLFGNLSVYYEFENDGTLRTGYEGYLIDSWFPSEIDSGIAEWKYDGKYLTVGDTQYELTIVDHDRFVLTSNDRFPQMSFNRVQYFDRTVTFGRFEQDGILDNGPEAIEWYVIEKTDEYILLLSKYALATVQYTDDYFIYSFEESTLYNWLNTEFLESFNDDEHAEMLRITADEEGYSVAAPAGSAEYPYVSLLSLSDAEKYTGQNIDIYPTPTVCADLCSIDDPPCLWLSTTDYYGFSGYPCCVDDLNRIGSMKAEYENYVRPIICIEKRITLGD